MCWLIIWVCCCWVYRLCVYRIVWWFVSCRKLKWLCWRFCLFMIVVLMCVLEMVMFCCVCCCYLGLMVVRLVEVWCWLICCMRFRMLNIRIFWLFWLRFWYVGCRLFVWFGFWLSSVVLFCIFCVRLLFCWWNWWWWLSFWCVWMICCCVLMVVVCCCLICCGSLIVWLVWFCWCCVSIWVNLGLVFVWIGLKFLNNGFYEVVLLWVFCLWNVVLVML